MAGVAKRIEDDFGWPCLTRRPRPSHPELLVISRRLRLSPQSLFTRRQTSFSSSSCPVPSPPPNQHRDFHLNAVLGCRRLLNHTLFANIETLRSVFVRSNIQRTKISTPSVSNNSPAATHSRLLGARSLVPCAFLFTASENLGLPPSFSSHPQDSRPIFRAKHSVTVDRQACQDGGQ